MERLGPVPKKVKEGQASLVGFQERTAMADQNLSGGGRGKGLGSLPSGEGERGQLGCLRRGEIDSVKLTFESKEF